MAKNGREVVGWSKMARSAAGTQWIFRCLRHRPPETPAPWQEIRLGDPMVQGAGAVDDSPPLCWICGGDLRDG